MTTQAQIIIDKSGHIIRCNDVRDRMMRSRQLRRLTASQITGKELRSLILPGPATANLTRSVSGLLQSADGWLTRGNS